MEPMVSPKGLIHHYTAVDGGSVREDAFRFTIKDGRTQVDVAAVIPPLQKLDQQRFMEALYEHVGSKSGDRLAHFFHPQEQLEAGFQEDRAKKAIICSYVLDQSGRLVYERMHVAPVITNNTTYAHFNKNPLVSRFLETARHVLSNPRHAAIQKFSDGTGESERKAASDGPSGSLVHQLLMLFNDSCRMFASRREIPYIRRDRAATVHIAGYKISRGLAKFNCGLRDPCAFINATNLSARLTGGRPSFPEQTLRKLLPHVND